MKLAVYSVIMFQTCCVYATTAFRLHLHRNVNSKTGNITSEGSVNVLGDNVIGLQQSSQRSKSGKKATNFFNTSLINQKIHSLKLLNESRIQVLQFLARLREQKPARSGVRVTPPDTISAPGNPSRPRRLHRRTPATDNFLGVYTDFYQLLQPFLWHLSQRFKEGTSPTLQNVGVIAEVMPLDDLDILSGNTANIINKFFVVQETTLVVLYNIRPFVLATYLEWFRSQSALLRWRMNIVGFVILSLGLRDDDQDVSPMNSFCTNYAAFFRELEGFVALVRQRYKSDAPAKLRDVELVCNVLPPDDQDFVTGREVQCKEKYNCMKQVMTLVFKEAGRYVEEEHLEWFQEQSERLQQMMDTATKSLATHGVGGRPASIEILSPGISGVNTGVKPSNNEVLVRLNEVIKALQ